jgi:hypothetical protein
MIVLNIRKILKKFRGDSRHPRGLPPDTALVTDTFAFYQNTMGHSKYLICDKNLQQNGFETYLKKWLFYEKVPDP